MIVLIHRCWYSCRYSADFLAGLASLPKAGPGLLPAYQKFINTFGTHVPSQVTIGGMASLWSSFEEEDYNHLVSTNVDLEQGSRASFLFFFGASKSSGGRFSMSEQDT